MLIFKDGIVFLLLFVWLLLVFGGVVLMLLLMLLEYRCGIFFLGVFIVGGICVVEIGCFDVVFFFYFGFVVNLYGI